MWKIPSSCLVKLLQRIGTTEVWIRHTEKRVKLLLSILLMIWHGNPSSLMHIPWCSMASGKWTWPIPEIRSLNVTDWLPHLLRTLRTWDTWTLSRVSGAKGVIWLFFCRATIFCLIVTCSMWRHVGTVVRALDREIGASSLLHQWNGLSRKRSSLILQMIGWMSLLCV